MAKFKKSSKVQWKWLGRIIEGVVEEIFETSITRTIKGKSIKRNGSKEKPAYLVRSNAGNEALTLETELTKTDSKASFPKQKADRALLKRT